MDKRIEKTIETLRPMDDDFFHKLAEDTAFCEEILRVILQNKDLKVVWAEPQKSLRNIEARSVRVDVLCEDSDGIYYNIEVQKKDDDDHQRRVRYNASNIDTYISEKGTKFKDLPDVYVVYISSFDFLKEGHTIYHVDRILREPGTVTDHGMHEVYVNTKIDDGTEIAGLMKIFKSSEMIEDARFPAVCARIRYFKEGKGRDNMSLIVEEVAREIGAEMAVGMAEEMAAGMAEEMAAGMAAGMAEEMAAKIAKERAGEVTKKTARELIKSGIEDIIIHRATELSMEEIQSIRNDLMVQGAN